MTTDNKGMNGEGEPAIAIVTWNSAGEIGACLDAVLAAAPGVCVTVLDNASKDTTVAIVRERFPEVGLVESAENLGYAAGCNRIAATTRSEFLLFLNPDAEVRGGAIAEMLEEMRRNPDIGVLSPAIVDASGEVQRICHRFPDLAYALLDSLGFYRLLGQAARTDRLLGEFFDHRSSRDADWIWGACLLVRRVAFEKAGGFPEDYFLFAEDTDLCYAVRAAGFRVRYFAGSRVAHAGNRSAGQLPGRWRAERTLWSKYAFCFKRYGVVRTRLIQLADLAGALAEAVRRGHRTNAEREAAGLYRRALVSALFRTPRGLLAELRKRPDVSGEPTAPDLKSTAQKS